MAATNEHPFIISRKPLPGYSYAAVPLHSASDDARIPPSLGPPLHGTHPSDESCSRNGGSRGREQNAPLLSTDAEDVLAEDEDASKNQPSNRIDASSGADDSSTENQKESDNAVSDHSWTPFWLHWAVLLAFCALFLLLLAGMIILYYFARHNDGISAQMTSNHYYWTYGPTAVLMIVVALWRQVDYTCRQLVPWEELSNTRVEEQRSLTLDYISPILTTSLFRAIKYRHWSVVTSLVGFMLLKLITIFSTGLLVLSPTHTVEHGVRFATSSSISTKSYCSWSEYLDEKCDLSRPSIDSVLNFGGILSNRVPYPQGTNSQSMFEVIDVPPWTPPGAVITATVQGYYPKLECAVASVHNNSGLPPRSDFNSSYSTDSVDLIPFNVSIGHTTWEAGSYYYYGFCNPAIVRCPSRVVATHDLGPYLNNMDGSFSSGPWLLMVNVIRYNQTIAPTLNKTALPESELWTSSRINVTEWSVHIEATTAVLCNVSYSIEKTLLRLDTSQDKSHSVQAHGPISQTDEQWEGYTNNDVWTDFDSLMNHVYPDTFPSSTEEDTGPNLFDLMSQMAADNDNVDYLDPQTLMGRASRAFEMLAAQMASEDQRVGEKRNVTGSMEYYEDRLHVKSMSFWVMAVGFVSMFGLTLIVLVTRPKVDLVSDPGSLGHCAWILTLQRQPHSPPQEGSRHSLMHGLTQGYYSLALQRKEGVKQHGDWQPFAASNMFKFAALGTSCATLVVLAVLQYVSDSNNGIVDVQSSGIIGHSLSTYIPAAFMLFIATLCTSAAFVITTLYPYYRLQRGSAKAEQSILPNICGKSPGLVLYTSLRYGLVAPGLITIASIISALLTIVVSGLYTTTTVPLPRPVLVTQLDHFNFTWNSSAADNGAMTVLNLLEHSNGSFPPFTFNELAIPTVEFAKDQSNTTSSLTFNSSFSLTVLLPVLRGSLNCTVIPKDDFSVVEVPYNDNPGCMELSCGLGTSGSIPNTQFEVTAQAASYCNLPDRFEEKTGVNYSLQLVYPTNDFEGGITSLSGCPSLAFTLGYFSNNQSLVYKDQDTTNKNNVTTFVCSQYIEEATTDVHFVLPSLAIDASRPPVFNESKSRIVSTEQWDIGAQTGQLSNYPQYHFTHPSVYNGVPAPLDTFMQLVLSGKTGIPPDELIHAEDADRFIDAVQHIYRVYIAQAINSNMRQNFTTSHESKRELSTVKNDAGSMVLNATLVDPTRMRLVQNKTSAIVLEILIGLILMLSIAAYSTVHLNNILPHDPCSIAGVMSLLDGSHFCDLLRDHVGLGDEKERHNLFKAWRYSLGWWDVDGRLLAKTQSKEGEIRFGIDIDPSEPSQKSGSEE